MKILFDHSNPFLLAHGGFQIQIEQTKAGLEAVGVEVEYLRWWDARQRGEIIHYFGRPPSGYIQFAHQKKIRVIMAPLLTGLGSRSSFLRGLQKLTMSGFETILPQMVVAHFGWDSFRRADACIALTPWEAHLMGTMFGAVSGKTHVLPNGVEPVFLNGATRQRDRWLVCTATITQRKRVFELAQAAVCAQTPLWIIGSPYFDSDPYALAFVDLAQRNPKVIRYEGAIHDRKKLADVYRAARGFVLLSTMESLSLSALEAAACGCPLLLSDLPWAHSVFKREAFYVPITKSINKTAQGLRNFYDDAPNLPPPSKPQSWIEIAGDLKKIYETVRKTPDTF